MNPLNYGSLEACKRLVDNGIVLETEAVWWGCGASLHYREYVKLFMKAAPTKYIPAPSMAEVWRELPEGTQLYKGETLSEAYLWKGHTSKVNSNPTDALIDLLIWVR